MKPKETRSERISRFVSDMQAWADWVKKDTGDELTIAEAKKVENACQRVVRACQEARRILGEDGR